MYNVLGLLVQERSRLFDDDFTVLIQSILHGEPTKFRAVVLCSFLFVYPRWFWRNPTFLPPSRPFTGSPSCKWEISFNRETRIL